LKTKYSKHSKRSKINADITTESNDKIDP